MNMSKFLKVRSTEPATAAILDEQHREIHRAIDSLREAIVFGHGFRSIHEAADRLIEVTLAHFESEEEALRRRNYRHAAEHAAEHKKFAEEIQRLAGDLRARKLHASLHLLRIFEEWTREHLENEDRLYIHGPSAVFTEQR